MLNTISVYSLHMCIINLPHIIKIRTHLSTSTVFNGILFCILIKALNVQVVLLVIPTGMFTERYKFCIVD